MNRRTLQSARTWMKPSLDIIVVNWNSGEHLERCLQSIQSACKDGLELQRVVVVDNASSDCSVEGLEGTGLPLRVISNDSNRGFAAACNQGAKGSSADYLLFLNPDTVVESKCLAAAMQFMQTQENSGIGICGIQLVDEEGLVKRSCSRFPRPGHFYAQMLGLNRLFPEWFPGNFMSEWDHAETRQVNVVTGAFFLVRRAVFETLGGFDEQYFVYLEDVDFAEATHRAKWGCVYLASAQAYHKGGGCSEQVKAARLFYSLCSRILYGYKHFKWITATSLLLGTLFVEPLSRIAWTGLRGSLSEMGETLSAYRMLWLDLPRLLAKSTCRQRPGQLSKKALHSSTAD